VKERQWRPRVGKAFDACLLHFASMRVCLVGLIMIPPVFDLSFLVSCIVNRNGNRNRPRRGTVF
jgi:cytochrome c oxidase subunit IV